MDFLKTYSKEIVALLVPLLTWFVNRLFQPKAKLAWAMPHSFTFLIQEPFFDANGNIVAQSHTIKTGSILIQNIGESALDNVEVVFNWKPILNIWPVRHFEEKIEADNRYVMIFDTLSVKEFVQIELIETSTERELPRLLTVRCKQCVAQNIQLVPQQVAAPWVINIIKFFVWMGLFASVYVVIILIQFLVLGTPKVL